MEGSDQLYAPAASSLRKVPWYPLKGRQFGLHNKYERFVEDRNTLPVPEVEPQYLLLQLF
jgi:hypothetical protein